MDDEEKARKARQKALISLQEAIKLHGDDEDRAWYDPNYIESTQRNRRSRYKASGGGGAAGAVKNLKGAKEEK